MTTIERLQRERQNLVERLSEINTILSRYEELERLAESVLHAPNRPTSRNDAHGNGHRLDRSVMHILQSEQAALPTKETFKTPMDEFEQATLQVLADSDTPLDRAALYEKLTARNIVIGGSDEAADLNTLSARMSRLVSTINIRGHGYWLKERPFAELGYWPSKRDEKEQDSVGE